MNPCFISRHQLNTIRGRSISVPPERYRDPHRNVEDRFKAYVKAESQQMTRHWKNSVDQQARQRTEEQQKAAQKRTTEDQRAYEEMREQQRQDQKAKIEEIEAKIRCAQPGPKALDGAKLLAECLNVQEKQRQERALVNISNRQQEIDDGFLLRIQNQQWALEHQHRQQERHLRAMHHKQDLRNMIEQRRIQREREMFHLQTNAQQMMDPFHDHPTQKAIEKERKEMERRRIQMRQTATDAMRMAEQRRLREKMTEAIQDKMCEIHNEGKARQEEIVKEQTEAVKAEQKKRQDAGREQLAKILDAAEKEQQEKEALVMANAAQEYRLQLLDREKAEVERKKKLKAQRIQFHLEEMRAEKEKKLAKEKQANEDVRTRLTNEAVTREFMREQQEKRIRDALELRRTLALQTRNKENEEKKRKEDVQQFTNRNCDYSKDHRDFLSFAKEAVAGAQAKQLPIQPFVRVINAYQRHNFVEEKPLLPHLQVHQPAVYYERKQLPRNNDKAVIRYNIDQLRALNPILAK